MWELHKLLQSVEGITIEPWLNEQEFQKIKKDFWISIDWSLRNFLSEWLPIWGSFINWRKDDKEYLEEIINWPLTWIVFDIENNNFWLKSWWEKPFRKEEQIKMAKYFYDKAPKLIPLYGHRYYVQWYENIISIRQTDIIGYWNDLESYFEQEFSLQINPHKLLKKEKVKHKSINRKSKNINVKNIIAQNMWEEITS